MAPVRLLVEYSSTLDDIMDRIENRIKNVGQTLVAAETKTTTENKYVVTTFMTSAGHLKKSLQEVEINNVQICQKSAFRKVVRPAQH